MDAGRSQDSWVKDKKSWLLVHIDHSEFYVYIVPHDLQVWRDDMRRPRSYAVHAIGLHHSWRIWNLGNPNFL